LGELIANGSTVKVLGPPVGPCSYEPSPTPFRAIGGVVVGKRRILSETLRWWWIW